MHYGEDKCCMVGFFFIVFRCFPRGMACTSPNPIAQSFMHCAGARPPQEVTRDLGFLVMLSQQHPVYVYLINLSSTSVPLGHKIPRYSSQAQQVGPDQRSVEKCVHLTVFLGPYVPVYHVMETCTVPSQYHFRVRLSLPLHGVIRKIRVGFCLHGRGESRTIQKQRRGLFWGECLTEMKWCTSSSASSQPHL